MIRIGRNWIVFLVFVLSLAALGGCAAFNGSVRNRQAASVVEYLYPASQPAAVAESVTRLQLPVRVGIAFVPAGSLGLRQIPEAERNEMLERVKASFEQRPFISKIEVIPGAYLRPRGGFENLDQVARMFQLDVICLLSYDQIQYADDNSLSVLYWTIVGAYVIPATKYTTHTLLDAAVFDVQSRRLLFRAPGVSHSDAHRPPMGSSEYARGSMSKGFEDAMDALIPALHVELDRFRERVKNNAETMVKVEQRGGGRGFGGAIDFGGLALLLGVGAVYARRR